MLTMDTFKDEMTAKERSEAYFKGEEVDRLPVLLCLRKQLRYMRV